MTALRRKLLGIFDVECREHLEAIRRVLGQASDSGPVPVAKLEEATRRAHSLKGAARAVGLDQVEALAHGLESLFLKVKAGEHPLRGEVAQVVAEALDNIEDRISTIHTGPAGERPAAPDPQVGPVPGDGPPLPAAPNSIRINAENLDRLLKSAGELHADMLFEQLGSRELTTIYRDAAAFEQRWLRFWKQLEAGLKPGARSGESTLALRNGETITAQLKSLSGGIRAAALRQGQGARLLRRHLDDLEQRVMAARLMPAESVFGGFRKMVRDIAAREGKQLEVRFDGLQAEADRLVLENIKDPVMHILRNAVSHGIEPPDIRRAAGKSTLGRVTLAIATAQNRLSVVIEDDGRGIDFAAIAGRAVRQNVMTTEQARTATQETLSRLLFAPGFSTAGTVTTLSGRGMGLSVARETVASLQGTLGIAPRDGGGTRIEILLPVSILSRRLLVVGFADQVYALPSESVLRVLRVTPDQIVTVQGRPAVRLGEAALPLIALGAILGTGEALVTPNEGAVSVIVLRGGAEAGSGHIGVAVHSLIGVNDFVVRNLDLVPPGQRFCTGIVATADGSPCLVLDPESFSLADPGAPSGIDFDPVRSSTSVARSILVVDDSITTRTLEKSILESHGYQVRLSVDGRDALHQLRTDPPDIVVTDIEMPNLDGFELVREMKSDARLAEIPVILVTSRADAADREMGLRLGAEAYVVKQKFDQDDLLRTIRRMV